MREKQVTQKLKPSTRTLLFGWIDDWSSEAVVWFVCYVDATVATVATATMHQHRQIKQRTLL